MKEHDKKYYLDELVRLFEPKRIYRKFGGFGEDAFVAELQQYYHDLTSPEQQAFAQAILRWLWSSEELRRMQAIRLCGDIKLRESVDDLLRMGEILRKESLNHEHLGYIVHSLGQIGDEKALDFLVQEATMGAYRNGAVMGISRINLDQGLQYMRILVVEYWKKKTPVSTEWLFSSFLTTYYDQIEYHLGRTLRDLPDKSYLIERFREAVRLQGFDAEGKYLTKRMQRKILQKFREGLEQEPVRRDGENPTAG